MVISYFFCRYLVWRSNTLCKIEYTNTISYTNNILLRGQIVRDNSRYVSYKVVSSTHTSSYEFLTLMTTNSCDTVFGESINGNRYERRCYVVVKCGDVVSGRRVSCVACDPRNHDINDITCRLCGRNANVCVYSDACQRKPTTCIDGYHYCNEHA